MATKPDSATAMSKHVERAPGVSNTLLIDSMKVDVSISFFESTVEVLPDFSNYFTISSLKF